MELKNLYTVKKVIETGSYQNAAAALNYAPSTITFQIKQLEEELGVQLFEKSGHKMELTQQGKEILPLIDGVLAATEELLCFGGGDGKIRGTLTVALPETLVTYKLQPILKRFKELAPEVKLSFQVLNCYAIYEQMLKGGADIALHYDVSKYPASFETKELRTYPLALVCAPAFDAAQRDFSSPAQRKAVSHIRNDPNALFIKIWGQYLRERDIVLDAELDVWSIEAIKRSVMSNLGVAFLPRFAVAHELESGTLHEIETEVHPCEITAICVHNKNKWQNPAMKLFMQLLDEIY